LLLFIKEKKGVLFFVSLYLTRKQAAPSRFVAFATTMDYITRVEKKTGGKSGNKWTATETSAWTGLVRTQQFLINRVEKELRENGLPPLSWYDVLWELERAPGGVSG
jgi:hypothetical protein